MKTTVKELLFAVCCWWLSWEYGGWLIHSSMFGTLLNGALLVVPMFVIVFAIYADFGKREEDEESWTHEDS